MTENTLLIGLVVFIIVLILTKSGNKCENMLSSSEDLAGRSVLMIANSNINGAKKRTIS